MKNRNNKYLSNTFALLVFFLSSWVLAESECDQENGCEKKFCNIEEKLKQAQHDKDEYKVDGLTTALAEAKENCTTKELQKELVAELKESQITLGEYKEDLSEANEAGKSDKVDKYEKKVKEEEQNLERIKQAIGELGGVELNEQEPRE